jgi:imidazolonepropionase-like amidohydrolase
MQYQGRDCIAHTLNMLRALQAEGVRLVTGTDIPSSNAAGHHSAHDELQVLVQDVGLSPLDALRTATVNAAAHMNDAESGTVVPGQRAELLLLRGNPLDDIAATRQVEAVLMGDALLTRAAIERGLDRVRALYDAMPVPKHPETTA